MADILGAVSAADSLLESTITLISRLRKAYARHKGHAETLDRYAQELASIREVVSAVQEQECLRLSNIASQLQRLTRVAGRLHQWVEDAKPGDRNAAHQFSRHLVHGSKDEKVLAGIMQELSREKASLCVLIQAATMEKMRTLEDAVITRIDALLVKHSKDGQGLKTKKRRDAESRHCHTTVNLDRRDTGSGSSYDGSYSVSSDSGIVLSQSSTTTAPIERVVTDNTAESWALQVNGPIGQDLYKHVSHLTITGNVAKEDSTQFNYAVSDEHFQEAMEVRKLAMTMRFGKAN